VVVALNGGTNALIFTTASSMFIESTSSDTLASTNILASNDVGASRLVSSLTKMKFHWNIPLEFQPERRSRGLSLRV